MSSKPVLGYWDVRGYGNPIRFLLTYVGQEFEDKRYSFGSDLAGEEWYSVKFDMGLDFPNVPYYLDGDYKLTQSQAIMRYLGRKYKLCATTEAEQIQEDMLVDQARDLYSALASLCYSNDVQANLPDFKAALPGRMKIMDTYLGNKKWFLGDKITHVDFALYEVIDAYQSLFPKCLDQSEKLSAFVERLQVLPAIKAYMESNKYIKAPLFGRRATVGGSDATEVLE